MMTNCKTIMITITLVLSYCSYTVRTLFVHFSYVQYVTVPGVDSKALINILFIEKDPRPKRSTSIK